jgi:hypothetical protein
MLILKSKHLGIRTYSSILCSITFPIIRKKNSIRHCNQSDDNFLSCWMGGHWLKRMRLNDPKERKKGS